MEGIALDDDDEWGQYPISGSFDNSQYTPWESWSMPLQVPLVSLGHDESTNDTLSGQSGHPSVANSSSYQTTPTAYWSTPSSGATACPTSNYQLESPNIPIYRTAPADKTTPVNRAASSLATKEPRKRRQKHQLRETPTLQPAKRPPSQLLDNGEGSVDQGFDIEEEHSKRIQQRNRIASNKFRVKKRNDAIKLKSDEEGMERINRELNNRVADLTRDVHDLKMQLLQHTNCNCSMIQEYISNEAQRFVQTLDKIP